MELAGLSMENFPPVAGNDSKTLRKLSLLEARMIGAGNESRDASLPANDSSRGSENNSNSMSTIGFAKPRASVATSPGRDGAPLPPARGHSAGLQSLEGEQERDGGGAKRKAPTGEAFSPARPAPPSHNSDTPSTLSTSPGESRGWNTARTPSHGLGGDNAGCKRARSGSTLPPPPPPLPPPRSSPPRSDGDRQGQHGAATGGSGPAKVQQGHPRRGSRETDGHGSPSGVQAAVRTGSRHSLDRTSQARDHVHGARPTQGAPARTASDAVSARGSGASSPPRAFTSTAGPECSPSGLKSSKGGVAVQGGVGAPTIVGTVGAAKTIQSYFFKPSNGLGVQTLSARYGTGEGSGMTNGTTGLPREVDLSGTDDEKLQAEQGQSQTMARVGRSGSPGGMGGGISLQQRFSHVASAAGDQGGGQGQGQRTTHNRGPDGASGAGGGVKTVDNEDALTAREQESLENAYAKLREAEALEKRLRKELDRANLERTSMESMADTLQKQLDRKIVEFKTQEADRELQKKQLTSVVEGLLRKVSAQEASDCRAKLARDMLELGKIVSVKTGQIGKYVEAFEEGSSFKEGERKLADMLSRKSKLEARKRAVTKLLKASAPVAGEEQSGGQARLEAVEEEETVRMHLAALKREEVALQEEKRALDARKVLHIRELKRVAHEDRSKFSKRPTLNGRYVLLNLLGKGGFSEVWRAFDLVHAEDVAVKVHQLLNNWNEPQKANFIRHVTREYEIHQQMRHPRIVNLTDVFEICCDSFATVLDYCRGTDLECLLRERKQLPERDARALVLQVARGLLYLNTAQGEGQERRGAIIHYDLKPGNILLDESGDVKITDFGLSKILEIKKDTERGPGGGTSMELTSKGAGTYWYLPPECFGDNPRISSKVDVWSLGVVFYQMLYGVRPFGEGLSQEKILREKVIVNANRVEFPSKPVVSEEAKSFIRSCLTYTHATRPDVHGMCNLPYLNMPLSKRGA